MMTDVFSDKIWEPSESDMRRAVIEVAMYSTNPTIIDAIDQLAVLLRLTEPEKLSKALNLVKNSDMLTNRILQCLNRAEVHELVDETFNSGHNRSIYALDNFIDIARENLQRKTN